jgi:hypothetical protein
LFLLLAAVGLLITLPGCSGGSASTAAVTGKVTSGGEPVTSGSVTFAPAGGTEGKPAVGAVQSDGSYTLSTYAQGDGAVIGKHSVVYSPGGGGSDDVEQPAIPEPGSDYENQPAPEVPFSGLVPKESEVEVKAGTNEINIELIPDPNAGGGQGQQEGAQ